MRLVIGDSDNIYKEINRKQMQTNYQDIFGEYL